MTPHITRCIPWLEKGRIDRSTVLKRWGNMLTFIKERIDEEQYVYTLFDVSRFDAYKVNELSVHEHLIYGYNDEKKEIYFCDNICKKNKHKLKMCYNVRKKRVTVSGK